MTDRNWCLWLDESGDFRTDSSVIAGVLLEEPDGPQLEQALRAIVEGAIPFGAWPPHAAHLNAPTFLPAAWAAAPGPEDWPGAALMRSAAAALENLAPALWAQALADARKPAEVEPHRALTRKSRAALPEVYSALCAIQGDLRKGLFTSLQRFSGSYARGCFVVASAAVPGMEPEGDLYLETLTTLFERVYAVLRGTPGPHRVWLIPASRHVRAVPGFPAFALRPTDVGDCARTARAFPLGAQDLAPEGTVRLTPAMPRHYDDTVHPGIVLADFISNQLLYMTAHAPSWAGLEASCRRAFALPVSRTSGLLAGAGPLPCIAATGDARAAVTAVMANPEAVPVLPPAPGWARDQAGRWIAARRRLAGVAR